MRPPAGFEATKYPLQHKLHYAVGLSAATALTNSTMLTLVKNYNGVFDPIGTEVNPHNSSFATETGAVCAPMSIIDKLRMTLSFSLSKQSLVTEQIDVKGSWMPIFFSFPEKLDAIDEKTTNSVANILELTKDSVQEDVTPTWTSTKLDVVGESDKSHPLSTVNLAESATTHLNMTTDATMQGVAWDADMFHDALRFYTNKGALKACIGKTRHFNLKRNQNSSISYRLNKFVPKAIRRIMPYTFMAILIHIPIQPDIEQNYWGQGVAGSKTNVGVKLICNYHEWNFDHDQTMKGV